MIFIKIIMALTEWRCEARLTIAKIITDCSLCVVRILLVSDLHEESTNQIGLVRLQ